MMDDYKIYTPWLKGIKHYDPNDYKSLEDFCRSVIYSIHNICQLVKNENKMPVADCFFDIINALKMNPFLTFCGKGTFASVFLINGFSKTLKINISSIDSINDPWIEYINKIHNEKIKNSWLPTVDYIFAKGSVYGAIGEVLKPIKDIGNDFDKHLLDSIRACLRAISSQSFKNFKYEQEKIKILLITNRLQDNTHDLLNALDIIIKIKKEQNAEIDLVSPNVMVDSLGNIILNDPLSFGKYSSLK